MFTTSQHQCLNLVLRFLVLDRLDVEVVSISVRCFGSLHCCDDECRNVENVGKKVSVKI